MHIFRVTGVCCTSSKISRAGSHSEPWCSEYTSKPDNLPCCKWEIMLINLKGKMYSGQEVKSKSDVMGSSYLAWEWVFLFFPSSPEVSKSPWPDSESIYDAANKACRACFRRSHLPVTFFLSLWSHNKQPAHDADPWLLGRRELPGPTPVCCGVSSLGALWFAFSLVAVTRHFTEPVPSSVCLGGGQCRPRERETDL